jgi:imidazolonepropionase-like amidohydrolase
MKSFRTIVCMIILHLVFWVPFVRAKDQQILAIKAGKLLDVVQGKIFENQLILIQGDRIKKIGPEGKIQIPADASTIDLSASFVLPGFIDCHTHVTQQIGNYLDDTFRKSSVDWAVICPVFAKRTLEAGFTTIRDLGSRDFVDVALKKAIASGMVEGPRMIVAGHMISATGGHGDISGFSPQILFDRFSGVADGVDEVRKKVRWNIKYGADVIKFAATAGVLSEEESAGEPAYSTEEMKAIVEEAHLLHKKVAAHAHGAEGIRMAVAAGVDSIEHGSLIDDEGIRIMKSNGTYLTLTMYPGVAILQHGAEWGLPQKLIDKARLIDSQRRERFKKAIHEGVKIAYGTDAGVYPHGMNAEDFPLLVQLGMSPMQAIQSATVRAADLLGKSNEIGSLEPGKSADLVAVGANPLEDINSLKHVQFVMKAGVIYKNEFAVPKNPGQK